jgi:TolB protein
MDLKSRATTRLTDGSSIDTSPSYSPDGSKERVITEGYLNEGPTFAPNGLFVMFFRDPGGESGPKIFMADIFGHGEFPVPTPGYASDPSWGPLMS